MPKGDGQRTGRVGDLLHRELARLIQEELKDPQLGMITISGVTVSDDLSFARVYVTVLQDDREEISMQALNNSANNFRAQMAKTLKLRIIPKIKFYYDTSLRNGTRMDQLINRINTSDGQHDE